MIADAAKSKMARKIVLRRQTGMDFTGPLGLVACAKCFLAVFLSIFSVHGGNSRSACRDRARCYYVNNVWATAKKHGNLSDFDVSLGSIATELRCRHQVRSYPVRDQTAFIAGSRRATFAIGGKPRADAPRSELHSPALSLIGMGQEKDRTCRRH